MDKDSPEARLSAVAPAEAEPVRRLMERVIVASLADASVRLDTLANVNRNVDYWLTHSQQCVHIKAVLGDELVGVVLVKDFWNLCSLFVDQRVQGTGIGRRLVATASVACSGRSPKQALFLNAASHAVGFYERLGFVPRESNQPLPPGFRPMQLAL
ncbi:GNAT family N-acetyltransferase [Piscinibacter sp. XHJ-5]|uniref:GNAT family N-acetyltransferase n=1 Tax=Piscinibacter sp. XHJ-5 TaxID=3037797 RepID=UPI002452D166|nr:GNAT family N-acetyltransferase [Piscinibacter sp. XHJ-5]